MTCPDFKLSTVVKVETWLSEPDSLQDHNDKLNLVHQARPLKICVVFGGGQSRKITVHKGTTGDSSYFQTPEL